MIKQWQYHMRRGMIRAGDIFLPDVGLFNGYSSDRVWSENFLFLPSCCPGFTDDCLCCQFLGGSEMDCPQQ